MSTTTVLTKLTAAISDADVMIKLCKAGYLNILGEIFEVIYVPMVVFNEVQEKTDGHKNYADLTIARSDGWLVVIAEEDLKTEQRKTYKSFLKSYDDMLDRGELHAAALANEIKIEIILSDDNNAKRIINHLFQINGLAYWELIYLYSRIKGMNFDVVEVIHQEVNKVVDQPIGVPFDRLMRRAEQRILEIKIL